MNVLLQGRIAAEQYDVFKRHADADWKIAVWHPLRDQAEDFAALASAADVIVGGNIPLDRWPPTPRLKLFQIPWTGFNFTTPAQMPAKVPVANCFEHESAIAEYVLLAMLEWQIRLREMDSRFRREGWGGRYPAGGIFHDEIRGKTLGIYGYGHIGAAVAKRADAFGMEVIGTRRTAVPSAPAPLTWLGGPADLQELMSRSDFLLIACDLNDATRNVINATSLAWMQAHAVLINISRGAVVDEAVLFDALKDKRIGGAVIDVWYNYNTPGEDEVWPSNLPFHELDNTILSAHECGWTRAQVDRRWQFVADNVRRVAAGNEAENVVFNGTQTA